MRSLLDVDPAVVRVPAPALAVPAPAFASAMAEDVREPVGDDLPDDLAAVVGRRT